MKRSTNDLIVGELPQTLTKTQCELLSYCYLIVTHTLLQDYVLFCIIYVKSQYYDKQCKSSPKVNNL